MVGYWHNDSWYYGKSKTRFKGRNKMSGVLAINGGEKLRKSLFPYQSSVGLEEKQAAMRVMESQLLSSYRGSFGEAFFGGTEVKALEKEWAEKHGVKYAVCCNSCTSALHIACGAIGLKPDDEVIVTPWSMTCSASAPLVWGARPVFADVCDEFFCLDPDDVKKRITDKTKAIIVVSIFGNPYRQELNQIAEDNGLFIIEDAAQAVGASYKGKLTGSLGDIGCFSFTQGKHMTAGEGGILTTNNYELMMKARLIMNHAEAVVHSMAAQGKDVSGWGDMYGFNMRITSIQAAIIREQLKKWKMIVEDRKVNSAYLNKELSRIPGIRPCEIPPEYSPSYYVQPFYYDEKEVGVPRDKFMDAVRAEMRPERGRESEGTSNICVSGYITPIYRMPLFEGQFDPGDYPTVERLQSKEVFLLQAIAHPLTIENDLVDVVGGFVKVYENRRELK